MNDDLISNEDLISVAGQIESSFAGRKLYDALATAAVIPQRSASALGSLKDALQKSPRRVVEDFPRTEAYQRLLDQLDAQLQHTRMVGRVLLAAFCALVVTTIGLAVWGFTHGEAAKDFKTWASAISSVGVGVWNRGNGKESARLFRDYERLVKARK